MKQKKKESTTMITKNESETATTSKQSRVSVNSKAIKKPTKQKKLSKEKVNEILEDDDDSLKENKGARAKSSKQQQQKQQEQSSSDSEFEEVEEIESESEPEEKKKESKSKSKPKPTKPVQKALTPQKPKSENNVLDDIDMMLRMEIQSKVSRSKLNKTMDNEEDESDFEEVEMDKGQEHLNEVLKRNNSIEVSVQTKKVKKQVDMKAKMERMFKAAQKQLRIITIKTHIVCWLTHGLYLNKICSDPELLAFALSLESKFKVKKFQLVNFNRKNLCELLAKINKTILCETDQDKFNESLLITQESLIVAITQLKCLNFLQYHLLALIILRNQSIKSRLCISFDVIPLNAEKTAAAVATKQPAKRPSTSKKNNKKILSTDFDDDDDEDSDEDVEMKDEEEEKGVKKKSSKKRKSETEIEAKTKKKQKKAIQQPDEKEPKKKRLSSRLSQMESDQEQDSDADEESSKSSAKSDASSSKQSEDPKKSSFKHYWLEVYLEEEKTWISVDPFDLKLTNSTSSHFEKRFDKKVLYVCGFDQDQRVKDVTKRYATDWEISTRLERISHLEEKKLWYERMLLHLQPIDAALDIEEEQELKKMRLEKELPQTVSEFKDHPLYVLKRHLLKFQSIYPEKAVDVGKFRDEGIYLRDNQVTLHSRQTWLKYARVVKPFEKAYKIVKGRLKQSEYKQGMRENPDLDLYGFWQTKMYEPPFAENGRVPRNEFGNVELFQPCMLPIGCVHIKGCPNLNRVCRKLNIDCVAAVIGFDAHGGFSHAVMDGWVICQEHEEAVMAAYEVQEVESAKKLIEKNEERILNNWKKLIRGVLIRERLKIKYNNKITTKVHQSLDDEHEEKIKTDTVKANVPQTSKSSNNKIVSSDDDDEKKITEESKKKVNTKQPVSKRTVSKPEPKSKPKEAESVVVPKVSSRPSRARQKRKTKLDEYEDDEEDEDEDEYKVVDDEESDYEIEVKPKSSKSKKNNPQPAKQAVTSRAKKMQETVKEKPAEINKQSVNVKSNHNDDLNLSNDEE